MQAGPPGNIEPSELWRLLQEVPRPSKVVDFPRKIPGTDDPVGQMRITPLSQSEQMACNSEADKFAKKLLKEAQRKDESNLGYDNVYANEVAVQVLYRACRSVDGITKPIFPNPGELREKLSADEVGALFALYCQVQVELGPIITRMSTEEMEAWIVRLEEGGQQEPFAFFSLEAQLRLVSFMASLIVELRTQISSAGSPLDAGEPSEPQPEDEPVEVT